MAEEDEIPWYRQPTAPAPMEQPVAQGMSADERAVSDYSSPGEGRSSLIGMLGAQGVDSGLPGAASAPAGGGMGAMMLPLLMAQMQQQRQQAASPLSAFANAYAGATGQRSPLQSQAPSQYQQFQMIHSLMQDQALEKERQSRLEIAQTAQQRLADKAADDKTRAEKADVLKNADAQMALSLRAMGDDRREMRAFAGANFVDAATKRGYVIDNPDELKAAITQGDLSPKRLTDVLTNLARGVPRDVIQGWPGMSPALLDTLTAPNGPAAMMAQDTEVERKTKAADLNIKEAQLIEHKNPEFFKAAPEVVGAIQKAARERFGMTYDQLPDDKSKQLAFDTGTLAAKAAKMEEYKQQQNILYQKQAQLAQLHGNIQLGLAKAEGRGMFAPIGLDKTNIWVDKNTGFPAQGDNILLTGEDAIKKGFIPLNQRQVDIQSGLQRAKQEMANIKWLSDQMDARGLYSGSGNWPQNKLLAPVENFYKGTLAPKIAPTDSDRAILKAFDASKTALLNIDRSLGSYGVRAIGAFAPQLETLSPTTGKQGVELTMSQIEDAVDAQTGLQKLPGAFKQERAFTPPVLGKSGQTPPAPLATGAPNLQLPPASKMTLETFRARALAKYPAEEAMQKINEFMSTHRIVD